MMNIHPINSEKRQFSRIAFDAPVTLDNGSKQWKSTLLDISLKGALVSRPDDWDQDAKGNFKLAILLDNSDIEIDMEVILSHSEKDHIGFQCEHIDLDSVTSLRRLVELNLGDEELLEREISNMLVN
jgi:beta-lactamase superfamily II metal-dependent hydrolase